MGQFIRPVEELLEEARQAIAAMERRDRAIRQLKATGWPATRIAAELGMGIDNVRRILREKERS